MKIRRSKSNKCRGVKNLFLPLFLVLIGFFLSWEHFQIEKDHFGAKNYSLEFQEPSLVRKESSKRTNKKKQRRKFVKYISSKWEQLWLDNIQQWQNDRSICHHLNAEQTEQLQEFFHGTCTSRFQGTDWCYQDDTFQPFYINTRTFEISHEMPDPIAELISTNMLHINNVLVPASVSKQATPKAGPFNFVNLTEDINGIPAVFSKFVFYDELTKTTFEEYIEPLVSHLRHPLARCRDGDHYFLKRHYVIPPPQVSIEGKNFYFDAGASTWKDGGGGPSLSFFTGVWLRHGIDFDYIRAWEGRTSSQTFYKSVPEEYQNRTHYTQQLVAKSAALHTNISNFIPSVIKELVDEEDYVLFKLDIDHGETEMGMVNHLLDTEDIHLIDEFVFEHHVDGNYIMRPTWRETACKGVSLLESYQMFLKMRNLGVRAHSWV